MPYFSDRQVVPVFEEAIRSDDWPKGQRLADGPTIVSGSSRWGFMLRDESRNTCIFLDQAEAESLLRFIAKQDHAGSEGGVVRRFRTMKKELLELENDHT